MGIKIVLLVLFFAVMVAVGVYSRKHATSVDGFVLGGRSVGPWLTASHMEHPTSRQLYLSAMQDSSDGNTDLQVPGSDLAMQLSEVCWHGLYWEDVPKL